MPKYYYKCKECESELEVRHGITERLEDCQFCEKEGCLIRIPQITTTIRRQEVDQRQVGSLTKEFIEENKKILNDEKKNRIEYNE